MVTGIIGVAVLAIILGAILGGENLGDTLRKGLGCLFWLAVLAGIVLFIGYRNSQKNSPTPTSSKSSTPVSSDCIETQFVVTAADVPCYSKPNFSSSTVGTLPKGNEITIKCPAKYKNCYEISCIDNTTKRETKYYLRKSHVRQK